MVFRIRLIYAIRDTNYDAMTFQEFIEAYKKLRLSIPRWPDHKLQAENVDWGDYVYYTKNAFFCFEDAYCEDIIFLFDSYKAKDCYDGDYIIQSEGCYDSVDTLECFNCTYLIFCERLYDSHFCWDCRDSNNLFGCIHLQYKEYCVFNRQYTKEEYLKKVEELKKRPYEENLADMRKLALQFPVTTTIMARCENSDYCNQVFNSENLYLCFDSAHSEDSAYLYDAHHNKYCFDMTQSHWSEFCYENTDCDHLNSCYDMRDCDHMSDSAFSEYCSNSNHLFGCIALKNQQYCILNKQYTSEEYDKQVQEIMASLKTHPGAVYLP